MLITLALGCCYIKKAFASEVGGSFQVFVSSLGAGYKLNYGTHKHLRANPTSLQSWPCFNNIFMPATGVSVVAKAIRETANQVGMA